MGWWGEGSRVRGAWESGCGGEGGGGGMGPESQGEDNPNRIWNAYKY